jgi:D-3-phosphoglycerate dehydrogenase
LNFPQLDAGQVERYQHFVDLAGRMASFIGQIADGRIQSVALRYSGEVCEMNLNYLTSVVVQRLLSRTLREGVNLINAGHVARLRGIKVQETRVEIPENYTNLITIEIRTDVETHRVSGTVFTDRMPRIVNVDGFSLEVIPRGHMVYFSNNDKPGVIGNIGTVMGQSSVNIAGMQLGRDEEGGRALALLLVDNPVSPEVIQRLLKLENVLTAKALKV